MRSSRLVLASGAVLALLAFAGAAQARTTHYQCVGYLSLDAEFTPRLAQVHFQGENWTLTRVRDGREARYVGTKGVKVTVTLQQSALTLVQGDKTLQCKLISDALAQFSAQPPSAPSAPAR
jgi:hypothetical protein